MDTVAERKRSWKQKFACIQVDQGKWLEDTSSLARCCDAKADDKHELTTRSTKMGRLPSLAQVTVFTTSQPTRARARTHAHTHTHTHTKKKKRAPACLPVRPARPHTHARMSARPPTRTPTHARMPTHARSRTHAHAGHAQAHAPTPARPCMHADAGTPAPARAQPHLPARGGVQGSSLSKAPVVWHSSLWHQTSLVTSWSHVK